MAKRQGTAYQAEYVRKETTWAVRISEETKASLQRIVTEQNVNIGNFITALGESLSEKKIVFRDGEFRSPEYFKRTDEDRQIDMLSARAERQDEEIEILKEKLEMKNALLETIRETIREELRGKTGSRVQNIEVKNFPENKKGDLDLTNLYRKAEELKVTPQSILDTALKRYRL